METFIITISLFLICRNAGECYSVEGYEQYNTMYNFNEVIFTRERVNKINKDFISKRNIVRETSDYIKSNALHILQYFSTK